MLHVGKGQATKHDSLSEGVASCTPRRKNPCAEPGAIRQKFLDEIETGFDRIARRRDCDNVRKLKVGTVEVKPHS